MNDLSLRPKLGLALGGGGARGLAHIGVLKVLESAAVPIDFLTGSSMGGLIGALFAAGWSAEQMEAEALHLASIRRLIKLVDFSPHRRGLLVGQRVRAYLEEMLGKDLSFAKLRTPLAVTAVDLCTAQEIVLSQGSVVEAVLATTAVPGLLPPIMMGNRQLIDGGLLNNVPSDVARDSGAQTVIAVDVSPSLPMVANNDDQRDEKLWPAIFPQFAQDFYTAELIMVGALTRSRLLQSPPDLLLRPEVPPGISIFWGLTRAAEAIAAGEEAAREALPHIEHLFARSDQRA